jgi:predicted metal-dependent hydrolase
MKSDELTHIVDFGSRKIPCRLHLTDRKRLRIVVSPDLTVEVFAPEIFDEAQIYKTIQKKAPWIAKTLDIIETYHPLPSPKKYISGETLIYLGRQYRLTVDSGSKKPAKLLGRYLYVYMKDKTDFLNIKKSVDDWYRKRAHETLGRYMNKCHVIVARHGTYEPLMVIRNMRRRWGSCSTSGRITLNLNLIKVPVHCIEYVIMHELCHMKYHNHSKAFYSFLTRCQPDWRKRKEILDRFRVS